MLGSKSLGANESSGQLFLLHFRSIMRHNTVALLYTASFSALCGNFWTRFIVAKFWTRLVKKLPLHESQKTELMTQYKSVVAPQSGLQRLMVFVLLKAAIWQLFLQDKKKKVVPSLFHHSKSTNLCTEIAALPEKSVISLMFYQLLKRKRFCECLKVSASKMWSLDATFEQTRAWQL